MKGRKPKPSNLRRLQGNAGRRPIPENEPDPERGIPEPPKRLSSAALEHWRKIAPELDALGVLTTADGFALELLCEAYSDWRAACEAIETHGQTYKRTTAAGKSTVATRPEVAVRNDSWKRYKSMLVEFGMTPSARTRVNVNPRREKDAFERYLEDK